MNRWIPARAGSDQVKSGSPCPLVPAQAGTQGDRLKGFSKRLWIPACAGMSGLAVAVLALALASPSVPARAQSLPDLATYTGADRTQRLIAGAKRENALTIYSSMTTADM